MSNAVSDFPSSEENQFWRGGREEEERRKEGEKGESRERR